MIHAPGIVLVNLDDLDFRMHSIQYPLNCLAEGHQTITPTLYPLRVIYISGIIQAGADALVAAALAPISPEEHIVQDSVR
jgi:UDP-N-acetylglucosamine enolpyruvyl transferase